MSQPTWYHPSTSGCIPSTTSPSTPFGNFSAFALFSSQEDVLLTSIGRVSKDFNFSPNKNGKMDKERGKLLWLKQVSAEFSTMKQKCQNGFSTLYSAFAFLGRTTKGRRTGWSPADNGGGAAKSAKNDKKGNMKNVTAGDNVDDDVCGASGNGRELNQHGRRMTAKLGLKWAKLPNEKRK